jgi:hypothetical protein
MVGGCFASRAASLTRSLLLGWTECSEPGLVGCSILPSFFSPAEWFAAGLRSKSAEEDRLSAGFPQFFPSSAELSALFAALTLWCTWVTLQTCNHNFFNLLLFFFSFSLHSFSFFLFH